MDNYSPQQIQAAKALSKAAERMGWNGYVAEKTRLKLSWREAAQGHRMYDPKEHRHYWRSIYVPTEEHLRVVRAIGEVLEGTITPEEAMALLWDYDVMKQRGVL